MTNSPTKRTRSAGPRSGPSATDVRKAITSSGYPLEQRVAIAAQRAAFTASTNWTWWDNDAGKPQELDVAADLFVAGDRGNVHVHALVECKTFGDGLVVFESPDQQAYEKAVWEFDRTHVWGQPLVVLHEQGGAGGSDAGAALGWGRNNWPCAEVCCTQFGVLHRPHGKRSEWWMDNADAYSAADKLISTLKAYSDAEGGFVPEFKDPYLNVVALVIVVDGPIFRYALSTGPRTRESLRRVPHATHVRRCAEQDRRSGYRVDFVNRRVIDEYFRSLRDAAFDMQDYLSQNGEIMLESVQRAGDFPRP